VATATQQDTGDLVDQIASVVNHAVNALVITAEHDAEVCGCPGCRGNAADVAAWRASMLSVEQVV
jgi:hypothetical protein